MSVPAVRHHLRVLRADGRVERTFSGVRRGRGRPEIRYRLSERQRGDNLGLLSSALMDAVRARLTADRRRVVLQDVARAVASRLGSVKGVAPPRARMTALVQALNSLHYEARWEAGPEGPRVLLGHCPYAAIIRAHPELCWVDAEAISIASGGPARQLTKMDFEGEHITHCVLALAHGSGADGAR
jgi:predicted ArsR family transcriptional regulator